MDFEQIIISVISFSALFAHGIKICYTSAAHMQLLLSYLRNPNTFAGNFEQVIVPVTKPVTHVLLS